MAKITKITATTYRSLRFLSITPTGAIIRILGTNGQGKSNALEGLRAVLLGARDGAGDPITHGEDRGSFSVRLDDKLEAVMRWKGTGRTLELIRLLEDGETARVGKPRDLLDRIVGQIHDVGDILRIDTPEKERDLRDKLLAAAGVSVADLDEAVKAATAIRAEANAEAKKLTTRLAAIPTPAGDTPDEEVAAVALLRQEEDIRGRMEAKAKAERELEHLTQRAAMGLAEVERCRKALDSAQTALSAVEADIATHVIPDAPMASELTSVRFKLIALDETNAKVRAKAEWARLVNDEADAKARAAEAQGTLDALAESRAQRLASAELPIPGAAITDEGLTYNGERFHNLSRAQRLVVAVGLGIATRNKLDALWVDDAEGLDADNEALVEQMATAAGVQVFLASAVKSGPEGLLISGAESECETVAQGERGAA